MMTIEDDLGIKIISLIKSGRNGYDASDTSVGCNNEDCHIHRPYVCLHGRLQGERERAMS